LFHRKKADAPSSTSLALGRAAAAGRGGDFDALAIYERDGEIGPRPDGAIGFAVLRGGDSPGEHTVIFAGVGERVEIAHKASSRAIYTLGAVAAARWVIGKPAGLYSMRDVLGLA
jgi:4-hydroxy-tetrahydrodipicolinate reductase